MTVKSKTPFMRQESVTKVRLFFCSYFLNQSLWWFNAQTKIRGVLALLKSSDVLYTLNPEK